MFPCVPQASEAKDTAEAAAKEAQEKAREFEQLKDLAEDEREELKKKVCLSVAKRLLMFSGITGFPPCRSKNWSSKLMTKLLSTRYAMVGGGWEESRPQQPASADRNPQVEAFKQRTAVSIGS